MANKTLQPFATISVATPISEERVNDLLVGAIEGGSTHWVLNVSRQGVPPRSQGGPEFLSDVPFAQGGSLLFTFENPHPGPDSKQFSVGRDQLIAGLNIMAAKYPKHFADFLQENDDAGTSDIFLQCVIFGEEIYG